MSDTTALPQAAVPTYFMCDISKYQPVVNDQYKRFWLTFRSNDGTVLDENFFPNFTWAVNACKRRWLGLVPGRMFGFTVYCVYEPGTDSMGIMRGRVNQAINNLPTAKLRKLAQKHITVSLDVESWGGRITGNHSAEIRSQLQEAIKWLGHGKQVIAYANKNDYDTIFPDRPAWLKLHEARYSSQPPTGLGDALIGWQYTDGEDKWPVPAGYPRSTPPFGRCDHSVTHLTPKQYATTLGVGFVTPVPPPPPPPAPKPAPEMKNIIAAVDRLQAALKQHPAPNGPIHIALTKALQDLSTIPLS